MEGDQQINLKWHTHQDTLISSFNTFFQAGSLVDCTLAVEGKYLKAHKLVLSACSQYFATLLMDQKHDKHPIFILKDIQFCEIKAIMDYMYHGEMNIDEDLLPSILQAANSLQIKGLMNNGTLDLSYESVSERAQNVNNTNETVSDESSSTLPARRYKSGSSYSSKEVLSRNVPPARPFSLNVRKKQKQEMKTKPLEDENLLVEHLKMDKDHGNEEQILKTNESETSTASEPQYVCRRCGRPYLSQNSLVRHIRLTCNKRPTMKCPHCVYKSTYKWNLKRHVMKYHKKKFSNDIFKTIV